MRSAAARSASVALDPSASVSAAHASTSSSVTLWIELAREGCVGEHLRPSRRGSPRWWIGRWWIGQVVDGEVVDRQVVDEEVVDRQVVDGQSWWIGSWWIGRWWIGAFAIADA